MPEPLKILDRGFSPFNSFDKDVERKFNSNILIGSHGFDLIRDVNFNTENTSVARYFKGQRSKNFSAQFILVEVPDAAAGTFTDLVIQHDLKRTPEGILIVEQCGVDKTTYPYTVKDVLHNIVAYRDSEINWNKNQIKLRSSKLVGGSFPVRMVLMVY